MQELSDRAKAEHDLKRAAKELGATVKTSDFVLPDGQVPDVGSMAGQASVAFTMKPGEISGPINERREGGRAAVDRKPAADGSRLCRQARSDPRFALAGKQQERFGLFVSNLVDQMTKSGKIKKNEDELKNLSKSGTETGM